MTPNSTLQIDLEALGRNLRTVAEMVDPSGSADFDRLCAVLKADGYGLGSARIAKAMSRAGVRHFAAYGVEEAVEIAQAAGKGTVLVLMPVDRLGRSTSLVQVVSRDRLHLTAHHPHQLACLESEAASLGIVLPVHIEIDTGMGRGGCEEQEAALMLEQIQRSHRLRLAGVMTHLPDAASDPEAALARGRRLQTFLDAHGALIPADVVRHAAATSSLDLQPLHLDRVRVGLAWVGYGSDLLSGRDGRDPLEPILSWWSSVIQIRRLAAGRTIGYGCTCRTTRDTVAGLVPVGYADGLPLSRGEAHRVAVDTGSGPVTVPVLGRVNMDQCVVDLTDVGPVTPGLSVQIISSNPSSSVSLDRVAERAGVLPYQILCGLNQRIPRVLVAGRGVVPVVEAGDVDQRFEDRGSIDQNVG